VKQPNPITSLHAAIALLLVTVRQWRGASEFCRSAALLRESL